MKEINKNIQNIKEAEKAMRKEFLLRIIKVKNLKSLIMIAIKFMEILTIHSKIKINNLLKEIVKMNTKIKSLIIDTIGTKNIINQKLMYNLLIRIRSIIEADLVSIIMIDQIKVSHLVNN